MEWIKSAIQPARDGWDTEVFASQVTKQLKTLGKLLAHPGEIDGAAGDRKGSGLSCQDGPQGASHKRILTPFSFCRTRQAS